MFLLGARGFTGSNCGCEVMGIARVLLPGGARNIRLMRELLVSQRTANSARAQRSARPSPGPFQCFQSKLHTIPTPATSYRLSK